MNLFRTHRGFTLIELLVSLSLFSVVMMVSVGTLLTLVDANRQAQSIKLIANNLNFAFDSMTRTLRTGFYYHCGNGKTSEEDVRDCPLGETEVTFIDDDGDELTYSVSDGALWRNGDRLTTTEIEIEDARFYVTGTQNAAGDDDQPSVTIVVRGRAGEDPETESIFELQTTVVQRLLDV